MNSWTTSDDFSHSIFPFTMKFKNQNLELTYEKERIQKTIHVKIVILTNISIWFCYSLRSLQVYLNFELVSNPNKMPTITLLLMAIIGFASIILEIIILKCTKLNIFKGFIFTLPILTALLYTSYEFNIVMSNTSPYTPPIFVAIIICSISMSFIYCNNWICGIILLFIEGILFEIYYFMYPWPILDKLMITFIILLSELSISCTLVFYEYQRRENFYRRFQIKMQHENTIRIFNNIPLSIILTEKQKIVEVNESCKNLFRVSTPENINHNESNSRGSMEYSQLMDSEMILKMTHDLKKLETNESLKDFIESSKIIEGSMDFYLCRTSNNKQIPYEVTTTKIYLPEKEQIIFTLKNMEAYHELSEIKARQKYSTMFIASISHDFRTYLNIIGGNLDILNSNHSLAIELKHYIQPISKATTFLSIMVQDLIDFSFLKEKKFMLNLTNLNIIDIIDESCNLFAEKFIDKGLYLETSIPEQIPKVIHSDKMRITQVITNLLSNSWKFTIKGGVLVKLKYDINSTLMIISVKDSGIGIAPENIPKLMKPFSRIEDSMHLNENGILK